MEPEQGLLFFTEYLALVYHEARSARRLIQLNAVSKKTFGMIVDRLPPDDEQAWKRLIPVQQRCAEAKSAKEVEEVFAKEFGCGLQDLQTLFTNPAWKRLPQYGGPRWAAIADVVGRLSGALDDSDQQQVVKLIEEISAMHHNSGTVHEKLARLKGGVK